MTAELDQVQALLAQILRDPTGFTQRLSEQAMTRWSGDGTAPQQSHGHVTSACHSPNLGAEIALGLLADGRSRHGQEIVAVSPLKGRAVRVRVQPQCFIDPQGSRLHD